MEKNVLEQLQLLLDSFKRDAILIDPQIEHAFQTVDPSLFVAKEELASFFADRPSRLTKERTIPAPSMTCMMLHLLRLDEGNDTLILATESGYIAALIAEITKTGEVYVVDTFADAYHIAMKNLQTSAFSRRVRMLHRDPLTGAPERAPWKRILINAAIPAIPSNLTAQLADEGVLLAPVGPEKLEDGQYQELVRVVRRGIYFEQTQLMHVAFVPLVRSGAPSLRIDGE